MPQMAPYNWLLLFLLFNMIMMFILSFNNYMIMFNLNKNIFKYKNLYSWKW
uniref:ATP synthase F0 subunit 8 n=1 Tax=Diadromus collaris TaxID=7421 RepID=U5HTG3_9HYME|nr:ATP synthase F0 subunit 8 [Diadromus collaris]